MEPHDAYRPPQPLGEQPVSRRALLGLRLGARARADIDYAGLTRRIAAAWEEADALLRALEPAGEVAAELSGAGPGDRVLDAGAGDGNVALACVGRRARVDACDVAPGLVERERARTGEGVRWRVADVQELPYPDASFDVVVSGFGAALAPRPTRTARELARVLRPGGRMVVTAWAPRGLPGRLDQALELPDGVPAPSEWGRQHVAAGRLSWLGKLESRTRTLRLEFADPDAMFAAFAAPLALQGDAGAARALFDRLLVAQNNRPRAAELDARYVLHTAVRLG